MAEKRNMSTNIRDISSTQHIKLVCESLINARNYERLDQFIWALPVKKEYDNIEIISMAKAFTAYRANDFNKLYLILQQRNYSRRYHRQLQMLWRSAHYIEAEGQKGRPLGAVGKYRVRRKYPLPKTIWDGENMSYCFPKEARELLNKAYQNTPYPSSKEKYVLAESAYLTVTQVSNWFKNKRQRARASDSRDISTEKTEQKESERFKFDSSLTKENTEQTDSTREPNLIRCYIYRPYPLFNYNNYVREPIQPTFYRLSSSGAAYRQKNCNLVRSYQTTQPYGPHHRIRLPCTCQNDVAKRMSYM